jgi:hypothetical protein
MTIFEKKRKQNRSRPSSLPILFGSTFLSSLRQTFLPLHRISFTYSPTTSTLPLPDPTSTNLVQQLNHKAQFAQSGGSTPSSNKKKKDVSTSAGKGHYDEKLQLFQFCCSGPIRMGWNADTPYQKTYLSRPFFLLLPLTLA